jgi:protein-disulfide isomerase
MPAAFEKTAIVALVTTAVFVTGLALRRELRRQDGSTTPKATITRAYVENWRQKLGVPKRTDSAPVSVVVISDLECPFCKKLHVELKKALEELPPVVGFHFVHYPLAQHRFAMPAARAAECARDAGKFDSFVDVVFERQDSLGLIPWERLARDAGIANSDSVATCARGSHVPSRVEQGIAAARALNVGGTPTILIDGWMYSVPPYDSVKSILAAAIARADSTRR